jgi:hypothetical protein
MRTSVKLLFVSLGVVGLAGCVNVSPESPRPAATVVTPTPAPQTTVVTPSVPSATVVTRP